MRFIATSPAVLACITMAGGSLLACGNSTAPINVADDGNPADASQDASPTDATGPDAMVVPDAAPPPACTPSVNWRDLSVTINGAPELVWQKPAAGEDYHHPDSRMAAYRTNDGRAHLMITSFENYRISGASLGTLNPTASETFSSFNQGIATAGAYSWREWVTSPYTTDGVNLYALAHSEWYGCLPHANDPTKRCSTGLNQLKSWVNAITLFASHDGGATWARQGNGANHVVYGPPQPYPASWEYWRPDRPEVLNYGMFHPSAIIREGEYFYSFARYQMRNTAVAAANVTAAGIVLLRTRDITRAAGWEAWNGSGFGPMSTVAVFPGTQSHDHMNVTWNTALCRYIMVFYKYNTSRVYATSFASLAAPTLGTAESPIVGLQHQETYRITPTVGAAGFVPGNYTNLLDPSSTGRNFETSGTAPYLYYSSYDPANPNTVFDRDVYRVRIRVSNDPFILPAGLFMVGSAIYYSNGNGYCVFDTWAHFVEYTGRTDANGIPSYEVRPDMPYGNACQGS